MNIPINRIRPPVGGAPLHQPDVFVRSAYIVDEMADVSASIAVQLVELRAGRAERSASDMKQASDKIAAMIFQLAAMNMTLATQVAKHQQANGSQS